MFKNNKLILVLLICLVTFAIGYALFSGNVSISSTIGVDPVDINISTTCSTVKYGEQYNSLVYTTEGIQNAQINCSGNNVQISATHLYPGTKQSYLVNITNNSNFDIIIKGMTVEGNVGNNYENKRIFDGTALIYSPSSSQPVGLGIYNLEQDTENIKNGLACIKESDCVISPGETYTITFTDTLNESLTGNEMDITISRIMKINIEQYEI